MTPADLNLTNSGGLTKAAETEFLTTCLYEAEQLRKLNPTKYQGTTDELYRTIRDTKYYASIMARMDPGTTRTLTPMYEFRVHDACNTVGWQLLTELKNGGFGHGDEMK